MRGPLPEGDYHLKVVGYQQSRDGILNAEVFYRPKNGGQPMMILNTSGSTWTGNEPLYIDATARFAAIPAACHDELVVRVQAVSGTEYFIEVAINLSIP